MTYTSGYQSPSVGGSSIYSPFNRSSATGPATDPYSAPPSGNSMGMDMLAVTAPDDIDRLSSSIDDKLARIRNAFSQPQSNAMMAPQFMAANTPSAPPVSQADLDWALQLETKVKQQQYQPNPQETARYEDIAKRLTAGSQPAPMQQTQQPQTQAANTTPGIPGGVSQADIDWAMQLENKVKQQNYQPTPQETARYEDIAKRLMNGGPTKTNTPAPVPTNTTPPVSQADLDWALQLETKVKQQQYQPNPQETARYEDIAKRLTAGAQASAPPADNQFMAQSSATGRDWSTWSKPFGVPGQPTMPLPIAGPNGSPVISVPTSLKAAAAPPQQQFQAAVPPQQYQAAPPQMPQTGGVSQQDIQWALDLETKVNNQKYQPNQQEMARYQDIANRMSAQPTQPAPVQQPPMMQPPPQQQRTMPPPPQQPYQAAVPPQQQYQAAPPQMPQTGGVSQQDLQWALDLENRVNNLKQQPSQQEMARYQDIANRMSAQPTQPAPVQQPPMMQPPQQQRTMPPPPQQQYQAPPQQYQAAVPPQQQYQAAPPQMPQNNGVSQQDIQWALDLENRVNNQRYQPNQQEVARYQGIANRMSGQQPTQPQYQAPPQQYQQPYQPMPVVPNQYPMVQSTVPQMLPQPPMTQGYAPQQPMMQYPGQPQYPQQPGMPGGQPQSPGFWSKLKNGFSAFMTEVGR